MAGCVGTVCGEGRWGRVGGGGGQCPAVRWPRGEATQLRCTAFLFF